MSTSIDEAVTKELLETLEDGRQGFAKAAEKLADSNRPDVAGAFRDLSNQRAMFADQLRDLARKYGDEIDESGSLAGALHRGWMAVKDAVAGDDPDGVLDAAEQGEDHAVSEYDKALAESEISDRLRSVIQAQSVEVKSARDHVRSLRKAA